MENIFAKELINIVKNNKLTYKHLELCSKYPVKVFDQSYISNSHVKIERKNNYSIFSINDPSCNYAMNLNVLRDSYQFFNKEDFNFLVLKGESSNKYFCPGGDVKEMLKMSKIDIEYMNFFTFYWYFIYDILKQKRQKTISIWNGAVMGGGVGISYYSKFKIATETTRFSMPESKFGFYTNCVCNHFLKPNFNSFSKALYTNFISRIYSSYEVYNNGFADYFILNKYIDSILGFLEEHDITKDEKLIKKFFEYLMTLSLEECNLDYDGKTITVKNSDKEYNVERLINSFSDEYLQEKCDINDFNSIYDYLISKELCDEIENLRISKSDKNNNGDSHQYIELKYYFIKYLSDCVKQRSKFALKLNYEYTRLMFQNLTYEELFDLDLKALSLSIECGDFLRGIEKYFIKKENTIELGKQEDIWNNSLNGLHIDRLKYILYDFDNKINIKL